MALSRLIGKPLLQKIYSDLVLNKNKLFFIEFKDFWRDYILVSPSNICNLYFLILHYPFPYHHIKTLRSPMKVACGSVNCIWLLGYYWLQLNLLNWTYTLMAISSPIDSSKWTCVWFYVEKSSTFLMELPRGCWENSGFMDTRV